MNIDCKKSKEGSEKADQNIRGTLKPTLVISEYEEDFSCREKITDLKSNYYSPFKYNSEQTNLESGTKSKLESARSTKRNRAFSQLN